MKLVKPDMRGDPMSPLRWATKSPRRLARELSGQGTPIGADTVASLPHEEGFSPQATAKILEGTQRPDRDAQFRHITDQAKDSQASGDPVDSMRRWWIARGQHDYPTARRLLITAAACGANDTRSRVFKAELVALALEIGVPISVCHVP